MPYQVNKKRCWSASPSWSERSSKASATSGRVRQVGMRVVIELRAASAPSGAQQPVQADAAADDTFGVNMVALVDNQPHAVNLKQLIEASSTHRRGGHPRTVFELRKARERAILLEGLAVALANIDESSSIIDQKVADAAGRQGRLLMAPGARVRSRACWSRSPADRGRPDPGPACYGAPTAYRLSDAQAQDPRPAPATPDRSWSRTRSSPNSPTGGDRDLARHPGGPSGLAGSSAASRARRRRPRRSPHGHRGEQPDHPGPDRPQDMVVTLSHGYVKSQPLSEYHRAAARRPQSRPPDQEDDWIDSSSSPTRTTLDPGFFRDRGRVYWLKVWGGAAGGRSRGKADRQHVPAAALGRRSPWCCRSGAFRLPQRPLVFMATARARSRNRARRVQQPAQGRHHRGRPRRGDFLIGAALTDGKRRDAVLRRRKVVRFDERRAPDGPQRGVRGMMLDPARGRDRDAGGRGR